VLGRTSSSTTEIVIWDNASTDGTRELLDSLDDPRVRVVHGERNVGQSAYAPAFELMRAPYLVELDDDVIEAPHGWDATMLEMFEKLPEVGFLAADLEDDPNDESSHARYHVRPHLYTEEVLHGVRILNGPTGGGCAMTSRAIYDEVGGFRTSKSVFFQEEAAYIEDIRKAGYRPAILADLKVHHAGGPYYSTPSAERLAFWDAYWRAVKRRERVKRALLRVPLARPLNDRFGFFTPPDAAGR
jgi:GT2 family glycosyltransferase